MKPTTWLRVAPLVMVLAAGAARAAEPGAAAPAAKPAGDAPAAAKPAGDAPAAPQPAGDATTVSQPGVKEVTLKGMLGCGKCSFHEAKACENVLKVNGDGGKEESYLLADNAVSRANHEQVCGPASAATVTGTISEKKTKKKPARKLLTASAITFE